MNINSVVMTGNLTRDPELRSLPSGMSVCSLRIATNTRRKDSSTGEWTDKANFFNVTVWGKQGENCAQYLAKGRPIAVQGRLEWRDYEKDGAKREAIDIIADQVQFLNAASPGQGSGGGQAPATSDVPADTAGFHEDLGSGSGSTDQDDDIPF